jgi:hypothetical protein
MEDSVLHCVLACICDVLNVILDRSPAFPVRALVVHPRLTNLHMYDFERASYKLNTTCDYVTYYLLFGYMYQH